MQMWWRSKIGDVFNIIQVVNLKNKKLNCVVLTNDLEIQGLISFDMTILN